MELFNELQVASLLHDDVLDHADTRRGISSLNHAMGNKVCIFLFLGCRTLRTSIVSASRATGTRKRLNKLVLTFDWLWSCSWQFWRAIFCWLGHQ